MRKVSLVAALMFLAASVAMAQDPVKVDSKHYKVEFENDQVRVLRITFAPGEKSVMHEHRAGVVVALTDHRVKFHFPGGKTEERTAKARGTRWVAAKKLLTENVGDKPVEVILVELKAK